MKKGFTMIELVFVIVIIGVLSGVAIPKFIGSKGQADIAKGKSALYAVRAALSSEKQNRFMNGDTTAITDLSSVDGYAFNKFSANKDGVSNPVLEYPVKNCITSGCWSKAAGDEDNPDSYIFHLPDESTCSYVIANGIFIGNCTALGD